MPGPRPLLGGMPGPRSLPEGVYAWSQVPSGSMPDTRSLSGGGIWLASGPFWRGTPPVLTYSGGHWNVFLFFLHSSCNCIACNDNSYYQVIVSIYL